MFSAIEQNYQKLWKALIRPPRAQYEKQDLGPTLFKKSGMKIKRTDVTLTNKRGLKLIGSHYQPYNRPCRLLPCVIYLHGNSSNQLEAQSYLSQILCHDITLFAFDFAGCGKSEGEYISLGYYQRQDVDIVFQYLRSLDTVSSIGILGRSMGAVTALMYADRNHEIGCVVLDSPFSNLQKLCKEVAKKYMNKVSAFSGIVLSLLSKTIKQKNQFEIESISPISNVSKAFIPALFIAAENDDFIEPHHTQQLYEKYSGEKQKMIVKGDHNSKRDEQVLDKISSFFYFGLHVKDLVVADSAFIEQQKKIKQKEKGKEKEKEKQEERESIFIKYQQPGINFDLDDNGYYNEDEQLKLAIEESLRISEQNKDKNKEKEKDNKEKSKDNEKQKKKEKEKEKEKQKQKEKEKEKDKEKGKEKEKEKEKQKGKDKQKGKEKQK